MSVFDPFHHDHN